MKVYFIGGLGADKRIFRHVVLPESFEAVYLDWLNPGKNESLENYAGRMAAQVRPGDPFYMVGLSLGGMIASEIIRIYPLGNLILVASIPHPGHLPTYFRWMQKAGLHKIIPVGAIKATVYLKRFFSSEFTEDKQIVRSMIRDADPAFIRWAFRAVLNWKGNIHPKNTLHIHGTYDIVLPVRYTRPTHIIPKGGHLMILDRAEEINKILGDVMRLEIENRKSKIESKMESI
jgi:pimeloyl-ACP methyl ester carboxylesterase